MKSSNVPRPDYQNPARASISLSAILSFVMSETATSSQLLYRSDAKSDYKINEGQPTTGNLILTTKHITRQRINKLVITF